MIILNGKNVEFGKFPNKESYLETESGRIAGCKGLYIRTYNKINWMFEDEGEMVQLAILKDHLDKCRTLSHLTIHYMPHSRMDRLNSSYAFSLLPISRMIKAMEFDAIVVKEPHSDVTPALLGADIWEWCAANVVKAVADSGAKSVFYPDAGAQKRYNFKCPYAIGYKMRDFRTGEITGFNLVGEVSDNVLIVDDMCSRGGTFVHSAKLLKQHGAKKVSLIVSYCENTVFKGELFDHIDRLYISNDNTMSETNDKITMI